MLSPDDFKLNGQVNTTVAAEELSRMCDKVPVIDDVFIADGTRTLSGTYQELLESMQFEPKSVTASDKTPYIERFGNLKSAARERCRSVASVENPTESIFLTRGTPTGWYDANSSIWTRSSITQASVFRTDTGPLKTNRIVWKLQSKTFADQNSQVSKIVRDPVLAERINAAGLQQTVKTQANTNIGTLKNRMQPFAMAPVAGKTLGGMTTISTGTVAPLVVAGKPLAINRQTYVAMNVAVPFAQKVALNRELGVTANSETQEVKSQNVQMDFSCALITLERSWILADIFDNAGLWYALMHKAGHYSNGANTSDNSGTLRAIAKAMIVVKDLSITAQWSEEDRKAAVSSLGIGSFNASTSYFNSANQNQLVAPGVQVIGWVCEVLPKMPMSDDPNVK
jgi:hypothetical protein